MHESKIRPGSERWLRESLQSPNLPALRKNQPGVAATLIRRGIRFAAKRLLIFVLSLFCFPSGNLGYGQYLKPIGVGIGYVATSVWVLGKAHVFTRAAEIKRDLGSFWDGKSK